MNAPQQVAIANQEIDLEKAIPTALERILALVAEVICEMERICRKEYLTEKELALVFSLSAITLKTQKSWGGGSICKKLRNKVLYARSELELFLSGPAISCEDTFFISKAGRHDDY